MDDVEKPRRKPGMFCPLWRKDVSRVCHTCDWWSALPVKEVESSKVYDHWACAMNMQTIALRDIGAEVNGVQRATESFRNVHAEVSVAALRASVTALRRIGQDAPG